MRGCGNGGTRVVVNFPAPQVMYLRRGWKTFAHIHSLMAGLVLYFKLMENGLLSVKVFGHLGTCLRCCVESSSGDEVPSSSGSDEEDSDSDDESVERGHVDLVSDCPRRPSLRRALCQGPSSSSSPSAHSPSPPFCLHLPHLGGKGQERGSRGTYLLVVFKPAGTC